MRDLAAVAEHLRAAWDARRRFLQLWAIDREVITPLLDRLAADLDLPPVPPDHPESFGGAPYSSDRA